METTYFLHITNVLNLIGELPDIEINHGDLINPLQALAQRDLDISRILFTSLFVSIYNQLDNNNMQVKYYLDNWLNIYYLKSNNNY